MKITYYPGCTASGTSVEYGDSTVAVMNALGIEWQEIPDWNCCGAASAKSLDHRASLVLPARNIRNAMPLGNDIYIPCAGCYNNTVKGLRAIEDSEMRPMLEEQLGSFDGRIPGVHTIMELFLNPEIRTKLEAAKGKLAPLKAAAYYGCAFLRPRTVIRGENPERPRSLDDILGLLGLDPVEWPFRSLCCGGDLSLVDSSAVTNLVSRITTYAREAGAELIITACPLCAANLEMRGDGTLPMLYITEVIAIALGADNDRWWKQHLIDPSVAVRKLKRQA